jgi:hypothetical protein
MQFKYVKPICFHINTIEMVVGLEYSNMGYLGQPNLYLVLEMAIRSH